MAKPKIKNLLLVIILGVPAVWYLFLQFFGNNEFQLDRITKIEDRCLDRLPAIFVVDSALEAENHWLRLEQNAFTSDYFSRDQVIAEGCYGGPAELLLVDEEGYLVGEYTYDLAEVDRLIIESELLTKLIDGRRSK